MNTLPVELKMKIYDELVAIERKEYEAKCAEFEKVIDILDADMSEAEYSSEDEDYEFYDNCDTGDIWEHWCRVKCDLKDFKNLKENKRFN